MVTMGTILKQLLLLTFVCKVQGHGYLLSPPARATRWRVSSNSIYLTNYDDNALFCGGFNVQYTTNGGLCGPCGDNHADSRPRQNEAGGLYGPVSRTAAVTYAMGSSITVSVQLTAAHKGYFEFRLCEHNNFATTIEQSCLDQHVLTLTGTQTTRYSPSGGLTVRLHDIQLDLPSNVQCSLCVLQWLYNTGNSWGTAANGTGCVGCGNQEQFKNCADIAIVAASGTTTTSQTTSSSTTTTPTSLSTTTTSSPTTTTSSPTTTTSQTTTTSPTTTTTTTSQTTTTTSSGQRSGDVCLEPDNRALIDRCDVNSVYAGQNGMAEWCKENCKLGYCPATHCVTCYC